MSVDYKLYNELVRLRETLKEQGRRTTGRAPLVCHDDALYAIAKMCPKKMSDLESIPGIGRAFIDNYGKNFVEVINMHYISSNEKTVNISNNASQILKELEKKLVSINRRNRLLYMPKLVNKYSYDLVSDDKTKLLSVLFTPGKTITICDLADNDPLMGKKYKCIVTLLREVNKDLRDRGQNDLYVGYPFVMGRVPGENFDIRCPLALFPVSVDRTPTTITLRLDDSRDVIYNNTLMLAYFKFNNIKKPLPLNVIEDLNQQSFLPNLLKYYKDNDMNIGFKGNGLSKFKEYISGEFPKFSEGEMYLVQNIVLGKFPVCSSAIQKDFDEILINGEINSLMNELLLEVNSWDYESDLYYGEGEEKDKNQEFEITEKNLIYIHDLDSSQENVLAAINNMDKLVIQGPPGTGKSQTITSLIAKCINEEKTVLMVSEKKTALDVVYSRLGNLSKYALLIDDVGNKELFYQQLSRMFYLGSKLYEDVVDVDLLAESIDEKIRVLERIAERLYRVNDFGIEPYKLYTKTQKMDLSNPESLNKIHKIHEILGNEIKEIKYDALTAIYNRFSNAELLGQLELFCRLMEQYPWLSYTKRNMSSLDIMGLKDTFNEYNTIYTDFMDKNVIARLLTKRKLKRAAGIFIDKYCAESRVSMISQLMKNPEHIRIGFEQYLAYDSIYPIYDRLSSQERSYINAMFKVSNLYNTLIEANNAFYNGILYENIVEFEAKNKEVLATIDHYSNIIRELSATIEKKKKLTRVRLKVILSHSMGNITLAKRNGDIQRAIESKRKWSVNKFISKFSFELFKGIKVWLLTPEVVSEIIPLEKGMFDLVIFDEASQMYIEKGLPTIYRAKKVIIAGDHKQLRPSSLGSGRMEINDDDIQDSEEDNAALEEESLLDLARFKYRNIMLNFHYRSAYEELIAFSNYAFYKGRLYVSPNIDKPKKPPIEFHKIREAKWQNRSNMKEAKYVVAKLKDIFRERNNEDTIGIITFNSSQRDLILD